MNSKNNNFKTITSLNINFMLERALFLKYFLVLKLWPKNTNKSFNKTFFITYFRVFFFHVIWVDGYNTIVDSILNAKN